MVFEISKSTTVEELYLMVRSGMTELVCHELGLTYLATVTATDITFKIIRH